MTDILFDTDVCIRYLRKPSNARFSLLQALRGGVQGYCSVITQAELLAGARTPVHAIEATTLLNQMIILPAGTAEASLAGDFLSTFAKSIGLGLGDAFIAATAVFAGLPVATENVRHFEPLPGVVLLDT